MESSRPPNSARAARAGEPNGQEPAGNNDQSLSGLLNLLPPELILRIMECLPQHQNLILGQACRALRAIALLYCRKVCSGVCRHIDNTCLSSRRLSDNNFFHLLCILARDMPDCSACPDCLGFHTNRIDDTPYSAHAFVCPAPRTTSVSWLSENFSAEHHGYRLEYHHVQTILKYTRMRKTEGLRSLVTRTHLQYLDRLLRPFALPLRPVTSQFGRAWIQVQGHYGAETKVVDGRLVVRSTWSFYASGRAGCQGRTMCRVHRPCAFTQISLGSVGICLHQSITPRGNSQSQSPQQSPRIRRGAPDVDKPDKALHRAVGAAFATPFTEVRGYCHACETDFAVKITRWEAVIHAWHHMGTESDSMEGSWAWQTSLTNFATRLGLRRGDVRRLWERRSLPLRPNPHR